MIGKVITTGGREYTIDSECQAITSDVVLNWYNDHGLTGRQFIVKGKRGATKLVSEQKDGRFRIVGC